MFEDHAFEEGLDDALFLFGEAGDGLELQFQIVGRSAFVLAEDQIVGADLKDARESLDNVRRRLRGAAFVPLSDGRRALVTGGSGGISFNQGQIRRIWGHTHPDPSAASKADELILEVLGNSQQTVFNVVNGNVQKVRRSK